jgi:monomeric sarcosine oxidase
MKVMVLGAGGTGSAAARFLAREGHSVTVLEQFGIDHDRGSSYGGSRIIRRVYADRFYTGLMAQAYPLWDELEQEAKEPLFLRTGGLFFGTKGDREMSAVLDALDANGVSYDAMDPAETRRRFPMFRLRETETAVYQEEGGILRASACVRANLRIAASHKAAIWDHHPVKRLDLRPDSVSLILANGEALQADRLIIAAGPWMQSLLHPYVRLRLQVTRQTYCHFEPESHPDAFEIGTFPIWLDFGTNFYGFPHHDDAPGVKVAWHHPGQPVNPNEVDRQVRESDREPLVDYCHYRLPNLSSDVVFEKVCLYTNTPNEDFILDRLPQDPRVVIVSGCSGHGFKFTVLLGRIAAWMATEHPVPWNLNRFRLSRFVS